MQERFISYAQNFEDVMLWRALHGVAEGFYMDVGAYSPIEDSVTYAFYERGWRGINVEPDPAQFEALTLARVRDVNLKIAVGDRTADMPMYFIKDTGLSTMSEVEANLRASEGMTVIPEVVRIETLASIWPANVPDGQDVHFLKVDVEGYEREVLLGNDWVANRPWIVIVESTRPNSWEQSHAVWEGILHDAMYIEAYWDGLNRFYVAGERAELLSAFDRPPNVFDRFVRASEVNAIERASRAEGELATLHATLLWKITRPLRTAARRLSPVRNEGPNRR